MLKIENMNKKLGSFNIKNISFEIQPGYIVGLVGENGSGKTSILKILFNLYRPDSGRITLFGMEYPDYENEIKQELGFVFKDNIFWKFMSLEKCGNMAGKFYKKYDPKLYLSLLEEFGLDKNKMSNNLSEGEKMKFQFAFAFSHAPKLLIIDEATGSFDPEFRSIMQKKMTQFVSDGQHSIIFVSHVLDEMERIADYIIMMHGGELIFCDDRESLLEKYRLVKGPAYKIKLLKENDLVYAQHNEYSSEALIMFSEKYSQIDRELNVKKPTIEEIVYFKMKSLKEKKDK